MLPSERRRESDAHPGRWLRAAAEQGRRQTVGITPEARGYYQPAHKERSVFLFKAAATTYGKVVKQKVHAFPYSPRDASEDEFVFLSKNKTDCADLEKQIQHVAKLLTIRRGTAQELEGLFPNVRAGARWRYVAETTAGRVRSMCQPYTNPPSRAPTGESGGGYMQPTLI